MKSLMQSVPPALALLSNYMNQNPTLTLNLELNDINVILAALQELPAKVCNPLTDKVKSQAVPQLQALQPAEAEPEVPAE